MVPRRSPSPVSRRAMTRLVTACSAVLGVAVFAVTVISAQSGTRSYTAPRTPWGDPDLQGIWNDATSTPLQRPSELAGKDVLTDDEAEDFQQQTAQGLSPAPSSSTALA